MLFDLVFFALPLMLALCLGAHAVRDEAPQFWQPTWALVAYCIFYIIIGREVLLYLIAYLLGSSCLFFL